MSRSDHTEIVILSSDSEAEDPPKSINAATECSRNFLSSFKPTIANVTSLAKTTNSLVKHSISVDKSMTVKLITKVTPNFVKSSTKNSLGAVRSIDVKESPKKKPKLSHGDAPSVVPSFSIIPLAKIPKEEKCNEENNGAEVKSKIIPLETTPKKIKEEDAAALEISEELKFAEMKEVNELLTFYQSLISQQNDDLIVTSLRKRLMKISLDSLTEYEETYQSFVQASHQKMTKHPENAHIIMKEFFEEIKTSQKLNTAKKSEKLASTPSTSRTLSTKNPSTSLGSSEDINAQKIKVLENRLKVISNKIDELYAKEIAVDEMEDDGDYPRIERLEKRFVQIYNLICKLKDAAIHTSRRVDSTFKFQGSRYKELNKAVVRLVREIKPNLPDFTDIYTIASKCNTKYRYCLSDVAVNDLAYDVLGLVCAELHKRRVEDLQDNLDSWSNFKRVSVPTDPAKNDQGLKEKLDQSKVLGRQKTQEVLNHFAERQDTFAREEPEKHQKVREMGEDENENEEDEDDENDESESDFNDEDLTSGSSPNEETNDLETAKDPPSAHNSVSEESDESESSSEEETNDEEDEEEKALPCSSKQEVKAVNVEGAGNLFYTCDRSGRENFCHFKQSGSRSPPEADVITID